MGKNKQPEISIIIRTYNEEKYLGECLTRLFNQKTESPFEVIIVDSESTDNTVKIAKQFPVRLLHISKREFSYGKSLNIGCQAAKGRHLVFLSADALPASNTWLSELIGPFDKKTAAVYGKQYPVEDANPLVRRFMNETWKDSQFVKGDDANFSNANSAIRRDIWQKIPFDESVMGSEDKFWALEVQKKGYFIKYNAQAAVYHSHNELILKFYKRYSRNLYMDMWLRTASVLFIYLRDMCHNLYDDVRYVLSMRENIVWIPYSFFLLFLRIIALIQCSVAYAFHRCIQKR